MAKFVFHRFYLHFVFVGVGSLMGQDLTLSGKLPSKIVAENSLNIFFYFSEKVKLTFHEISSLVFFEK